MVANVRANEADKQFAAFISYSHSSDKRTGALLEASLERFPAPWYKARRRQIYLDRGDLAASPDLRQSLTEAMSDSRYLLLIASPEAAASKFVQGEIDWWLDHRSLDELIILHSSGVIDFDGRGNLVRATALPSRLVESLSCEPNLVRLPGLTPAGRIDVPDSEWEETLASIVANLDGVAKHELMGEHRRNQRRWRRIKTATIALLSVLLVAFVASTVVAVSQLAEARRQQHVAVARLLLNEAQSTMNNDPQSALRLAEAALRISPDPENRVGLERLVDGTRYAGTLSGEARGVGSVAFSLDGRLLAVAAQETTTLWDTSDIKHPKRAGSAFIAQEDSITGLAFSPVGDLLATADRGGGVVLWNVNDASNPQPVGDQLENGVFVSAIAFVDGGAELLCALADGSIKIWDVRRAARPINIGVLHASAVRVASMALSGDGATLATGDDDGKVRLWTMTDPVHPVQIGADLSGGLGDVGAVALSFDGHVVSAGASDGTGAVWTLPARTAVRFVSTGSEFSGSVVGITITPDGQLLSIARQSGAVEIWDLTRSAMVYHFSQPDVDGGGSATAVALDPRAGTIAVGGTNHDVVLWKIRDEAPVGKLGMPLSGFTDKYVDGAVFTSNGRRIVAVSLGSLRGWDLSDVNHPVLSASVEAGDDSSFGPAAISEDGNILAVVGRSVTINRLDDVGMPTLLGTLPHSPSGNSGAIALRSDGRLMAVGNGDDTISLWDLADPAVPRQVGPALDGYPGEVSSITFGPDGATLVSASSGIYYKGPGLAPPGFDGRGKVILWDVSDPAAPRRLGQPLSSLEGAVNSVAVSPDGSTIAYGGNDGKVYLWSIVDRGAPQRIGQPLIAQKGSIKALSFGAGGKMLAAGNEDGEIVLWDTSDYSRPVTPIGAPLGGRSGSVKSLAFSPQGSVLASATYDGTVVLWDTSPILASRQSAQSRACAASGGSLDRTQWATFVQGLEYVDTCAGAD